MKTSFSEKLHTARFKANLTQYEVANLLSVSGRKFYQPEISLWEKGTKIPSNTTQATALSALKKGK